MSSFTLLSDVDPRIIEMPGTTHKLVTQIDGSTIIESENFMGRFRHHSRTQNMVLRPGVDHAGSGKGLQTAPISVQNIMGVTGAPTDAQAERDKKPVTVHKMVEKEGTTVHVEGTSHFIPSVPDHDLLSVQRLAMAERLTHAGK